MNGDPQEGCRVQGRRQAELKGPHFDTAEYWAQQRRLMRVFNYLITVNSLPLSDQKLHLYCFYESRGKPPYKYHGEDMEHAPNEFLGILRRLPKLLGCWA